MNAPISDSQHNIEIHENLRSWQNKPVLQKIYLHFYSIIASHISKNTSGKIVELGSGIGNLKMLIPEVICTDIFKNPWIDQVENAYHLSFEKETVSNLILFDVWHHLKYPGNALVEFKRVLKPGGRVIIFEPAMSLMGIIAFGLLHHEPVSLFKKIEWDTQCIEKINSNEYYAAQGNANRIFSQKKYLSNFKEWNIIVIKKYAAVSYVLSGGYSKKQLYPDCFYSILKATDKIFDLFSAIFATRMIIVLEKK